MNRHLAILAFACAAILVREQDPFRPGPSVPDKTLPEASAPVRMPAAHAPRASQPPPCPVISVHFSPNGGCTEEVVARIGDARRSCRLSAYGFTSRPVANALIAAHRRGVDVAVILDRSNRTDRHGQASALIADGVPVRFDASHPIQHSKYCVIDGSVLMTGSFNYTGQGERNSENMLTIRDATLAATYASNWAAHAEHSELVRVDVPLP